MPTKIEQAAIEYIAAGDTLHSTPRRTLTELLEAKYPGAIERAKTRRAKARFERRFTGPVPDWAKRFVKKHGGRQVTLTIRQSRTKPYSSGHCKPWSDSLVVTLGAGRGTPEETLVEAQAVVLHEIAHANVSGSGFGGYDPHGDEFYAEWRKLLAAEGILRAAIATGRFGLRRGSKLRKRAAAR